MAGRNKAEFTDKTKRNLAGRAGYSCSFPGCGLFLVGPHSDGENIVNLGVAAHIKGAASGSARYDETQTDEERKHISNGIWMCWNHSVQIDNDEEQYSVDTLRAWKQRREEIAKTEYANAAPEATPQGRLRPDDRHRLDTDGKYRREGIVVSYDPWMYRGFTMVKLSAEGQLKSPLQMPGIAVSSVQAYLLSVGLRGRYLHILAQMRNLKLHAISQGCPVEWESQFEQFRETFLNYDWSQYPGMEGAVFDLIAGDVKGSGEWSTFMIDITCLYPDMYSAYIDNPEFQ